MINDKTFHPMYLFINKIFGYGLTKRESARHGAKNYKLCSQTHAENQSLPLPSSMMSIN